MNEVIHCVTADVILKPGTLSFTYIGEVERPERDALVHIPWGHLWKEEKDGGVAYVFNVIQKGSLIVGGGYDVPSALEWYRRLTDEIPECSLLMSTADFEWFRAEVLEPLARPFTRYAVDHPVSQHA